ncbi:kinase-like protein [Auricularia subglabra TFB-10046 SS5]|nr:kinase-like protein [Auricularia subglabra TFB-10046 SS5]
MRLRPLDWAARLLSRLFRRAPRTPASTPPEPSERNVSFRGERVPDKLYLDDEFEPVLGQHIIDSGSFGSIHIKKRKIDHLVVAIKYLRYSDDAEKNAAMDRVMEKEVTPLLMCKHPNIIKVYGLSRDPVSGGVGIVTTFADKGALCAYLNTKIPPTHRYKILCDVAAGLEYLHSLPTGGDQVGVAHGDLHPWLTEHQGNVLIKTDGGAVTAMLGDFGLCKLVDLQGLTSVSQRPNGVPGVPAYVGPELYRSEELGQVVVPEVEQQPKYAGRRTVKADVFAFGMLAFTTLGGDIKPALCGGSDKVNNLLIGIAIVRGSRPLREHVPLSEGQEGYWDVIRTCWQGDASKRPTIVDVRAALSQIAPDARHAVVAE